MTNNNQSESIEERLFRSAWTAFITKVAEANQCSVNTVIALSNEDEEIRAELSRKFKETLGIES